MKIYSTHKSKSTRVLALCLILLSFTPSTHAEWQPFRLWFSAYQKKYRHKWGNSCDAYFNVSRSQGSWCENTVDCILANTPETQKANMAGAGILLGLTPTILGIMAPSIESMAFLGSERPFLSFLLACGTPTLFTAYPLDRADPLGPLARALQPSHRLSQILPPPRTSGTRVNTIEYVVAVASAFNVIYLSYDITRRSIISWSCPNWAWVLCWSFVPAFINVVSLAVFRCTVIKRRSNDASHVRRRSSDDWWVWRVRHILWEKELKPCSQRHLPHYYVKQSMLAQIARWVCPVISYVHYVLGTAILGSLLFIPFADAFPIVIRYVASGVVARGILSFELNCLNCNNETVWQDGRLELQSSENSDSLLRTFTPVHKSQVHVVVGPDD